MAQEIGIDLPYPEIDSPGVPLYDVLPRAGR